MKKLFALLLSLIMILSMIPVYGIAASDIEPRYVVTNCPNCGTASYVNYGAFENVWYDDPLPTHCELDDSPQWIGHQHEFTECYTLCRCTSCSYELKSRYEFYECCPVDGRCYKLY